MSHGDSSNMKVSNIIWNLLYDLHNERLINASNESDREMIYSNIMTVLGPFLT